MKKKIKPVLALALVVALLIPLVACGSKSSKIVGSWTKTEGNGFSYLEFFSDGTYISSSVNYEGNYTVDGNRLKLSGILKEAKVYTFEIKGDTLYLYSDTDYDFVLQKN